MTKVSDAAAQWIEARAELKAAQQRVDEAKHVLLAHFRKSKRASAAGVGYTVTTYTQLDTALARKLLGDRASEAEVERTRETLVVL